MEIIVPRMEEDACLSAWIRGPTNKTYRLQVSSNLRDWSDTPTVTNLLGMVSVRMPAGFSSDHGFCRAILLNASPAASIRNINPSPATPPSQVLVFHGHVEDSDSQQVFVEWHSNLDGLLSWSMDFVRSADELTVGTHQVTFVAWDECGAQSNVARRELVVNNALPTARLELGVTIPIMPPPPTPLSLIGQDHDERGSTVVAGEVKIYDGVTPLRIYRLSRGQRVTVSVPLDAMAWGMVQDDEGSWSAVTDPVNLPPKEYELSLR